MNNRLREALDLRGMKPAELSELTGISKGSLSHYIKQSYQPTAKPLYLMAKYLDVAEMWLAGYDTDMERKESAEIARAEETANITKVLMNNERYFEIISKLTKLDNSQLSLIDNMITQLLRD